MRMLHAPLTRRRFLVSSGALTAVAMLPNVLFAETGGPGRLVVVILRGALDGLSAVPPHGDPDYAGLHRELAIAPPSAAPGLARPGSTGGALALDATFGLHPSLGFLHERYLGGELIVFHAVASPYRDRSHFDGQNVLENGLTQPIGTADGWLNRALAALPSRNTQHFAERAVAINQNLPLILRGAAPVLSKSPLATPDIDDDLLARLADLYSKDDWFSARLSEAIRTEKLAGNSAGMDSGPPTKGGKPADRLSGVAHMAAVLMRSEGGPEIAVIEAGGWDTHANQGGAQGALAQRLLGLDSALRGLAEELGALWAQTAVLVVTEFGRTAAMNGTRGTDHGTGGCAFLVGGAVQGGRVVADWPGLARSSLYEGRDLRATRDLRSLFKGVLDEHMRVDTKSLATRVFPDSAASPALHGLIRA